MTEVESEIVEMQSEASARIADVLHFLIYHDKQVGLFHELRLSTTDVGKFSDVIARSNKWVERLAREKPEAKKIMWPSKEDIIEVQKLFAKYGQLYIRVLLGLANHFCPLCIRELRGG